MAAGGDFCTGFLIRCAVVYSLWREVVVEPTQLNALGLMADEHPQTGSVPSAPTPGMVECAGRHGFVGSGDRLCPCIG